MGFILAMQWCKLHQFEVACEYFSVNFELHPLFSAPFPKQFRRTRIGLSKTDEQFCPASVRMTFPLSVHRTKRLRPYRERHLHGFTWF